MKLALLDQITAFTHAKERIEKASWFDEGWFCKTGIWPDGGCKGAFFKLQKRHWSNDGKGEIPNDAKIFFSVWTDEGDASLLKYNIHAFKLRGLRSYKLESRKFASAFRAAFSPNSQRWPNLRFDFGPQTLMEGFQETSINEYEDTIVNWSERFLPAAELVDRFLLKAEINISGAH